MVASIIAGALIGDQLMGQEMRQADDQQLAIDRIPLNLSA
jgi:hypothetical protein